MSAGTFSSGQYINGVVFCKCNPIDSREVKKDDGVPYAFMHAKLKENASSIASLYYIYDMLLRQNITPEFAEEKIENVLVNYTR